MNLITSELIKLHRSSKYEIIGMQLKKMDRIQFMEDLKEIDFSSKKIQEIININVRMFDDLEVILLKVLERYLIEILLANYYHDLEDLELIYS